MSIRMSAAVVLPLITGLALVMANVAKILTKKSDPVTPNRTLQLELKMRHPVRGLDESRTGTGFRPCELHAVGCAQVSDSLVDTFHLSVSRANVPLCERLNCNIGTKHPLSELLDASILF